MRDVVLKPGRDRSLRRRHPWVLSGSVVAGDVAASPGEWVRVVSAEGEVLGFGHESPASQIRIRMLHFGKEAPGDGLLVERIEAAVAHRAGDPLLTSTDAVRLVNAEGDGLPGLVVDRYGDIAVVRLSSDGMAARRDLLIRSLRNACGVSAGYERADAPAARREGVAPAEGAWWGAPPPERLTIHEGERSYAVNVLHGQKTGFYLDQRDARERVERLTQGRRVLDLFSYTGGFAVAAARGGAARVTLVESSADALDLARHNLEANAPDTDVRFERSVVIDPPPLARRRNDVTRATRAYKDVLLFALHRAAPGARILCFTCSHHVGPDLFRKVCFGASLDAKRPLQVVGELGLPSDHPVALDHPEGRYLSGLDLLA
jgi:23S rRNA (cytosine1962-C5)-methyltransferase